MATSVVRIEIAGCGTAARIEQDGLLAPFGLSVVGCADPDLPAATAPANRASVGECADAGSPVTTFTEHRESLSKIDSDWRFQTVLVQKTANPCFHQGFACRKSVSSWAGWHADHSG
jgi:hypothetical protein